MAKRARAHGQSRGAGDPQRPRVEPANPARGGSEGYSVPHRRLCLRNFMRTGDMNSVDCSRSTLYRWQENGPERLAKTGGSAPTVLRGEHQFLLVLYRIIWPKATGDEVRAFICRESSDHAIFSREQVYKREEELGFSRKRASTLALQALTPLNVMRARLFWTQPPPVGRVGIDPQTLIDVDEFGIWVEKANRSYGKALVGHECREAGKYGHGDKFTCILAVRADGTRWFHMEKVAGTDALAFDDFLTNNILTGPRQIPALPRCTFLWDNLRSHHSAFVVNSVQNAGHRILPRPPYRPMDGPVEYVIHTIEQELSMRIHAITDDGSLCTAVRNIVTGLANDSIGRYFTHCGY